MTKKELAAVARRALAPYRKGSQVSAGAKELQTVFVEELVRVLEAAREEFAQMAEADASQCYYEDTACNAGECIADRIRRATLT